ARYGMYNSLAQLLLKITAPGIPDFYQGTEWWNFHMVDPDNRGPVDYRARSAMAGELRETISRLGLDRSEFVKSLIEQPQDGRVKLYTTMMGLDYRRQHPELFHRGEYLPLECGGSKKQHLCAFGRVHEDLALVTIVPRLLAMLNPDSKQPPVGAA